ncbi:MAG: hypothetical protein IJZ00_01435 [Lachnospiraceae bacterium]|nr:hypothetical protein [Lachnospiraceae bacterium]
MDISLEQEKKDMLIQLLSELSKAEESISEEGTVSADFLEMELELNQPRLI